MLLYITVEMDAHVRLGNLRFDAGSLSLNLVATLGRRFGRPVERLTSLDRLEAWLAGVGLSAGAPFDAAQLKQVQSLREDLDDLFRCHVEGRRPAARLIDRVNRTAGGAPQPRLRATRRGFTLERPGRDATGIDDVLGSIAVDAIRILTTADRSRLRTCEAPDCRMLYLTGPRTRRWCSSEHCGNRARVARHRTRRQTREPSER